MSLPVGPRLHAGSVAVPPQSRKPVWIPWIAAPLAGGPIEIPGESSIGHGQCRSAHRLGAQGAAMLTLLARGSVS